MDVCNNWIGTLKLMIETYERLEATYLTDVKPELSPVELNVCKNGIFLAKNLIQKKFPRLFMSTNQSYVKKFRQKGL